MRSRGGVEARRKGRSGIAGGRRRRRRLRGRVRSVQVRRKRREVLRLGRPGGPLVVRLDLDLDEGRREGLRLDGRGRGRGRGWGRGRRFALLLQLLHEHLVVQQLELRGVPVDQRESRVKEKQKKGKKR